MTYSLYGTGPRQDAGTAVLHIPDSLHTPDNPLHISDSVLHAPDSLPHVPDGVLPIGEGAGEMAMSAADAVYGPFSSLSQPTAAMSQAIVPDAAPLTGSVFYDVAILACFIAMCLILYFYRGYSSGIFNVFRGGAATEKMLGEQGKVFVAYLSCTITAGLLVAGLLVMKFAEMLFAAQIPGLTEPESLAAILGMWGVTSLIWGYGWLFLRVTGSLTLEREFAARLFFLKKITFAIWTVTVTPLFLLFALSDGMIAQILGIAIVAITAFTTLFLLFRTFTLFLRHNFSILLWILYLCAVEIFPISFAAVAAGRFLV